MTVLPIKILVDSFFFQPLEYIGPILSVLRSFWCEICWYYWGLLVNDKLLLSCCSEDSLFVLAFESLIIMCLSMGLWVHLTWSFWASWIFIFMSFTKLGKFSANISSNNPSALFCHSSPSGTLTVHMLICLVVSPGPWDCAYFSSILFLSVPPTQQFPLSYLQIH